VKEVQFLQISYIKQIKQIGIVLNFNPVDLRPVVLWKICASSRSLILFVMTVDHGHLDHISSIIEHVA